MKILFHLGSGNTDRPGRWHGINPVFTNLGEALIDLGHNVHMMLHSAAQNVCNNGTRIKLHVSNHVDTAYIDGIDPDICITWNGVSDGDTVFVNHVGRDKMIFGELGFFGHYDKTCYFDRTGVNTRYSMIGLSDNDLPDRNTEVIETIKLLQHQYSKPRLPEEPFIFVPLQDETDTQIAQYSPFKTMDEFLHHVYDIFRFDSRPILYKVHPRARCNITLKNPRVKEVTADVHHFIPYADFVFGLNSTVMVETLLYHGRIITYGAGIAARHFDSPFARESFIAEMYNRQFNWDELRDPDVISKSYLYNYIMPS